MVVTSLAKLAGTITDSNIYYNNEKSELTWEMYNYVNVLELPSDIVFVFHNIVFVKLVLHFMDVAQFIHLSVNGLFPVWSDEVFACRSL